MYATNILHIPYMPHIFSDTFLMGRKTFLQSRQYAIIQSKLVKKTHWVSFGCVSVDYKGLFCLTTSIFIDNTINI